MTGRVCYIVSRFPKVTETFVVNEWAALSDRFDMRLAALVHTDEPVLHDATRRALPRVWFVPPLAPATLAAHAYWLARSPRRYLSTIAIVLRARARSPREYFKTLVAFHQATCIARLVQRERVDHVHAHFANHPATAALVVHHLTGAPFSFTAHANDLYRRPALLARKATEADFAVAISEYNHRILAAAAPGATVHVVHCGVDTTAIRPVPRPARPAPRRLLCVAGFEPKKGHRDLLHAVAALAARRPDLDLRLTLVGDGAERGAVEQLAQSPALRDRVEFLGAQPAAEVRAQLRIADAFVLPAVRDDSGRMDGIPVALMEAMAAGVPVVTTATAGIPELAGDGCGVIVEPGNAGAISRRDRTGARRPGLRRAALGPGTHAGRGVVRPLHRSRQARRLLRGVDRPPRLTALQRAASAEDRTDGTARHHVRAVVGIDGTEAVLVRLGAAQEVDLPRPGAGRVFDGVRDEHAPDAVRRVGRLPARLVRAEAAVRPEAEEYADGFAALPGDDGRVPRPGTARSAHRVTSRRRARSRLLPSP